MHSSIFDEFVFTKNTFSVSGDSTIDREKIVRVLRTVLRCALLFQWSKLIFLCQLCLILLDLDKQLTKEIQKQIRTIARQNLSKL